MLSSLPPKAPRGQRPPPGVEASRHRITSGLVGVLAPITPRPHVEKPTVVLPTVSTIRLPAITKATATVSHSTDGQAQVILGSTNSIAASKPLTDRRSAKGAGRSMGETVQPLPPPGPPLGTARPVSRQAGPSSSRASAGSSSIPTDPLPKITVDSVIDFADMVPSGVSASVSKDSLSAVFHSPAASRSSSRLSLSSHDTANSALNRASDRVHNFAQILDQAEGFIGGIFFNSDQFARWLASDSISELTAIGVYCRAVTRPELLALIYFYIGNKQPPPEVYARNNDHQLAYRVSISCPRVFIRLQEDRFKPRKAYAEYLLSAHESLGPRTLVETARIVSNELYNALLNATCQTGDPLVSSTVRRFLETVLTESNPTRSQMDALGKISSRALIMGCIDEVLQPLIFTHFYCFSDSQQKVIQRFMRGVQLLNFGLMG